jgi:thiaminase (transcriptional activator TenA)
MKLFERLKADIPAEWEAYTHHEFVRGLGDGSLPEASFRHYLVQDYLFLIQFARAFALATYKAPTLELMRGSLEGLKAILDTEMQLHLKLCAEWGMSQDQVENTPEARATIAYTRFVLEAGHAGDLLDLYTALAPCMIGYAEIGRALSQSASLAPHTNPYHVWIGEYASDGYQALAGDTISLLDRLSQISLTETRYPRLRELFRQATLLEADFWEMGLRLLK